MHPASSTTNTLSMRRWFLAMTAVLAACTPDRPAAPVDNDYETPVFKRAKERYELRDFKGAIALYDEVLRENPNMAKAHLELGLIYDDKLGDYVSAIYHYRRYLALRPDGDRARIVEQWIPRSELSFAATLPNSPIQNAAEMARLQKSNLQLKQELEESRGRVAALEAARARAEAAPAAAESAGGPLAAAPSAEAPPPAKQGVAVARPPATVPGVGKAPEPVIPRAVPVNPAPSGAGGTRLHTVKPGETLWRIAVQYYHGNAQDGVDRILKANTEQLPDAKKLRVGQTIVIP